VNIKQNVIRIYLEIMREENSFYRVTNMGSKYNM